MFNCCFYYRISFTFSLVRSLRLAKLVGFSSPPPPPPLSLPPSPLPTAVHSVFLFSLSLSLSLFFCFCFYDFVLASVTCCLSTPALLPANIFRRFPSRFSAWAAAAARHVCVCLFYRKLNNCASYKLIMQQLHFVMLLSLVVVVADFIKYLLPTTALSVFEIVLHPYTQFPAFIATASALIRSFMTTQVRVQFASVSKSLSSLRPSRSRSHSHSQTCTATDLATAGFPPFPLAACHAHNAWHTKHASCGSISFNILRAC